MCERVSLSVLVCECVGSSCVRACVSVCVLCECVTVRVSVSL